LQAGGYGSDYLLVDFVDGVIAFNEDYAMRLPQCDFAVFLPDAGVEGVLLQLEAILVLAVLRLDTLIAAPGADERRLEAGEKENGQVRLKISAEESVQFKNWLRAKLTAAALVGFRRVSKAVAEDDSSLLERRLDHLGDGLGAVGEHERHLRHGRKAGGTGVED